jgi:ankyrin repeat protein
MMLEKKAYIDLQNKYGETALMIAMDHDKYKVFEMFIEYGANLMLADNNGNKL